MVSSLKEYTYHEISEILEKHPELLYICLRGKVYNLTNFQHPGGMEVLRMASGRPCADELFNSHHPMYVIEHYPSMIRRFEIGTIVGNTAPHYQTEFNEKSGIYKDKEISDFYVELKTKVEKLFRNESPRDSRLMYFQTALILLFYLFTYWLCYFSVFSSDRFYRVIFSALSGVGMYFIGVNIMHDGNHFGYSDYPLVNRLMGSSFDLLGGSSFIWKMIHTLGHHVHTNNKSRDPDIHTNNPHFRRIKEDQPFYFWYRLQPIYLPVLYGMLVFEFFFRDVAAVIRGGWGGTKFQPMSPLDWGIFVIGKIWYFTYTFLIPYYFSVVSFPDIILCYIVCSFVVSELLVWMFQVNHVTLLAEQYETSTEGNVAKDWAVTQIEGSTNFSPGSRVWNFLTGGLNHQIEHHLFPTISNVHYPKIAPIVQETCKKYGIQYRYYPTVLHALGGHYGLLCKYSKP